MKDAAISTAEIEAASLVNGFAGISDLGVVIPPDPHMAAGPDHVMGTVNQRFAIYDKSGAQLKLIDAGAWFNNVHPGGGPFDPQIVYDQHSNRWIMIWVDYTNSPAVSYVLLSISDDSNPLGTWCNWRLPGSQTGATPNTLLFDYPKIGVDADAVYVTGNMFDIVTDFFAFVQLRIIPKSQLLGNLCGPVTWTDFWDLRNPGDLSASVFTTVPAVTLGTPGVEYLVDVDFIFSTGTFMNLWSLTNPLSASPTLTAVTVPVGAFSDPPNAQQQGGGTPFIDVGGRRNRNVVYRDGSVWTAHSVADPTGQFAVLRYVRIDVNTATALEDVTFGADDFWYYYPAVQPDGENNILLGFTRSGANEYASARFTFVPNGGAIEASTLLKAGEDNYVKTFGGSRNRWGDYMGIALDPADNSKVWMFLEYAETAVGPGVNDDRWGTWFGQVTRAAFGIESVAPAPFALNLDPASDIAITFTQDANPATLNNNTIRVNGTLSGWHTGSVIYDGANRTATFTADEVFEAGEVVTVTLTTGIQSAGGDALEKPFTWSFSIQSSAGTAAFRQTSTPSATNPHEAILGDWDGDGDLDFAASDYDQNKVYTFRNNGNGAFALHFTGTVAQSVYAMALGDWDGDGDSDLAGAHYLSNTISILKNNGNGNFTESSTPVVGANPDGIAAGDWDGDGDMDLAVANNSSHNLTILNNSGTGSFSASATLAAGNYPHEVVAGDWDNDGDPDLAVANEINPGTVTILLNDGTGAFALWASPTAGNQPIALVPGDFDGDQDLDLAVANDVSNNVSMLKNDGNGNFLQTSTASVGARPLAIAAGDLDADGDLDLVTANETSGNFSLLANDGAGNLGALVSQKSGTATRTIVAGDLDNDGDLDLAATNYGIDKFSVFKNKPPIALPDTTAYGKIPGGDQKHVDRVVYSFDGQPGEMVLHFQAYDIDTNQEVDVLLNGVKVLDVPASGENVWGDSMAVTLTDDVILDTGANLLVFDNVKNPSKSWEWGVRRVSVLIECTLQLPVAEAYGKIPGGDQAHADKVTYCFAGQPGDLALAYQVFDVDQSTEVSVLLDGALIGYAPITADNQWSGYRYLLLPDALVNDSGNNVLVFNNTANPPKAWAWGVREVSVESCIPLPDAAAYGKISGGDQSHVDKVAYCFAGQAGDLNLSYEVYDIDDINEVDVVLNGTQILNVDPTADNQWSSTRTLLLPDYLVSDTETNLLVFDNTKNPPKTWAWGVREASLAVAPSATIAVSPEQDSETEGAKTDNNYLFDGKLARLERSDDAALQTLAKVSSEESVSREAPLLIKLPEPKRIDHILLYVDEHPDHFFSYRIEASDDGRSWRPLIDKSNSLLQRSQLARVSASQVSYLRISGESYVCDSNQRDLKAVDERGYWQANYDLIRASKPTGLAVTELVLLQERSPAGSPDKVPALPTSFSLKQNYPNPFNPQTMIEFALPEAGSVTLRIFNEAGQLVRTLIHREIPAGWRQARWDGRNQNGAQVAAGLYLCRLTVTGENGRGLFTQTIRMTLVK